jgi:hypothetical protein
MPKTFTILSTKKVANPSCIKLVWVGIMTENLVNLSTMTRMAVNFSFPEGGRPVIKSNNTMVNGRGGMCAGLNPPIFC